MQPQNRTVNYGEFAEFTCGVSSEAASHILELFIGRYKVFPDRRINLNQRELITEVNGRLGSMWILINNKTIPILHSFWCRIVFHDHLIHNMHQEDSTLAYIHVTYEECSPYPQQLTSAMVLTPLTSTTAQTTSAKSLQLMSTSDTLCFEPCTNGLISGTIITPN